MSRGHKIIQNFLRKRGAWDNNPYKDDKPKEKQMEPKKTRPSDWAQALAAEATVKIKQPGYNPPEQETIMNKEAEPAIKAAANAGSPRFVDLSGIVKKDKKVAEEAQASIKAKNYNPGKAEDRKDSPQLDSVKADTNKTVDATGEHSPKRSNSGAAETIKQNDSSKSIKDLMANLGIDIKPAVKEAVNSDVKKEINRLGHQAGQGIQAGQNIVDKSGAVHTPMSRARHLARLGMQMSKLNPKIGESWDDHTLEQIAEVHPAVMAMAKAGAKKDLRAQADKHTELALAANRAGDDAKVKFHQAQVAKIKAKMQSEEKLDELKASTLQSYSDKAHQQALDATYDAAHLNRPGEEKFKADAKKLAAKRAGGVQRAQTKLDRKYNAAGDAYRAHTGINSNKLYNKEELEDQKPMTFAHHAGDIVTCKKTHRDAVVQSVEGDNYTVVYADGSTETGPADYWTNTRPVNEARVVEQPRGWNVRHLKPAGHGIVGKKVRSYDFPGMHDSHYVEGHVTDEDPQSYHIRTTKVVRHHKEEPIPAHLTHIRAPKGLHIFGNAQGVYYAPKDMQAKPQNKQNLKTLRGKK